MKSIMYVPVTKDTKFIRSIIEGYSFQANRTCFSNNIPTSKAVADYFKVCIHDPNLVYIMHGKGYYLNPYDLELMVNTLLDDKDAWSIGITPYKEHNIALYNEEPTWCGRIVVYKSNLWHYWIDRSLKDIEWFVRMGDIAKQQGYTCLIANKARLFQVKHQPHGEELV